MRMLFIVLLELLVVRVFKTFFDVESDGEGVKRIRIDGFVVTFHIHEEGLLVAQVVVILNFIRQLHRVCLDKFHRCFLGLFAGLLGRLHPWDAILNRGRGDGRDRLLGC